jgi:hypothetical protein
MNAQVYPIFPTPLYVANYDKDLKDVIEYFDSCEMQDTKVGYGMISTNSYILDNDICNELNTFLMSCFKDFATNIMRYRFDDLQFAVSAGRVPPASAPTWEAFTTNTNEYSFAVNEYIDLQANEVFHKWMLGTPIRFHVHVTPKTANATGEDRFVKFTLYVAYADVNEVWTETDLTQELTIPTGTSALTHMLLGLGNVAFTNQIIGCQIKLRIKRIAATGGTEYADSVFITQVGAHLEQDTCGSRTEYVK